MKKLVTLATTLTLIFTLSIPVFAADTSANTNSNLAPAGQSSATDAATKAGKYKQYMAPVRELQKQEKQIREQIHTTRNEVHQQIKTARQAKNYSVLSKALNDMIAMQDDIASVTNATKTCLTDWQQYYTDRQAKNADGIIADLQKLQTDIQAKITVMNQVLTDLQKISADLNTPAESDSTALTT